MIWQTRPATVTLIQVGLSQYFFVAAKTDSLGRPARFRRIVRDEDGPALVLAICEGLRGRVLGGEWEKIPCPAR